MVMRFLAAEVLMRMLVRKNMRVCCSIVRVRNGMGVQMAVLLLQGITQNKLDPRQHKKRCGHEGGRHRLPQYRKGERRAYEGRKRVISARFSGAKHFLGANVSEDA